MTVDQSRYSDQSQQEKNKALTQPEFLTITGHFLKAREKSHVQGAIDFGFASHWLKNWREIFKPVTKRSNRNCVIAFDSPSQLCDKSKESFLDCLKNKRTFDKWFALFYQGRNMSTIICEPGNCESNWSQIIKKNFISRLHKAHFKDISNANSWKWQKHITPPHICIPCKWNKSDKLTSHPLLMVQWQGRRTTDLMIDSITCP